MAAVIIESICAERTRGLVVPPWEGMHQPLEDTCHGEDKGRTCHQGKDGMTHWYYTVNYLPSAGLLDDH